MTSTLKPEPLAFVVVILTLQNVKRSKYHCNLNKSDGKCVYVYVASHDFHDFGVRNLPNKHLKISPTQKNHSHPLFL